MVLCVCTPAQLREHSGHMPGCRFHVAHTPPSPAADEKAVTAMVAAAEPEPRKAYRPPALSAIGEGAEKYPIAHALALLVSARAHCPEPLAGEITAFLRPTSPAPPPPPDDAYDSSESLPDFGAELDAFARMPGSAAGGRLQSGPVMPAPPPPAPAFTWPAAHTMQSPPYSNGCPHPGTRLQRNGRGLTCLDCATEFPLPASSQ